jgi:thiamine biosynthesis protein ThiI
MMKRGCKVDFVHFHSHPIVDTSSMEKAAELTQMLTRFQYESALQMVPFGEIQQHIIVSTPPPYRVVLYRRFMVRIAEALARKRGSLALVTGDSLAQVSSQTLENITVVEEAATMPIFRPLIGFNKDEIINVARRIGTYPVSILPDQDCCTLFIPRHPVIRGRSDTVRKLEALLPVNDLVEQALEAVEVKRFSFPEPSATAPRPADAAAVLPG